MTAADRFPALIQPMLAVPGEIPEKPGWIYEFKWDGVRTIAYTNGRGHLKLMSRNDIEVTATYPELGVIPELVGNRRMVLDGEIVVFDERGVSSFERLQRRMHVQGPSKALLASTPVVFGVFDVLYDGGKLTGKPWHQRREVLDSLDIDREPILIAPFFDSDPEAVMATARARGLEGVVSKKTDGHYFPGRRSPVWIKTPFIQTTEVVVVGFKTGSGRRAGTIGSLIMGVHDDQDRLIYAGGVGTGFTDDMLDELVELLTPLETGKSPLAVAIPAADARGVHWLKPQVVGEVVYRAVTAEGRLRHPSWRGLRPDRKPREARLPSLPR